jgi:long-chain fatty acid transport protein
MNQSLRVVFLLLASTAVAHGAGFQIGEEGAPATGMAGAFTAKADDATAIFYNPAGIGKLRGLQVYAGGMLIVGHPEAASSPAFQLPGGKQDGNYSVVFIPNFYVSYGFKYGLAVGVGAFTNFGLKSIWPTGWEGRFQAYSSSLEDVTLNPSVAWHPVRWFSIGAGFDITPARVDLRRSENLVNAESQLRFIGNAVGLGGNVGVLFEVPRVNRPSLLSIGLSYRSRYDLEFNDGVIHANNVPLELLSVLHDTPATATLPIPDLVSVGVGVRPVDSLFLQVQFDWTNWSRLQALQLNAQDMALNTTVPEKWRDGYTMRVGGEYAFGIVSARLGFGVDWTPVPQATMNPIVPDAQRFLVSGGASVYLPKGFALEAAIMGVIFRDRTSALPEFPVSYSTWAVLTSFALSYRSKQVRHDPTLMPNDAHKQ